MDKSKTKSKKIKAWLIHQLKAFVILIMGFVLTGLATYYTFNDVKNESKTEFQFICQDLRIKIEERLKTHALSLRSGSAFFAASDSVSRAEWKDFIENLKINRNLPGIQGIGYSQIIPKTFLQKHQEMIRKQGFANYVVYPQGNRGMYTSIIYLEPFTGRNLNAFGYDMYSDSVRRKAMEMARDSDIAALSGKVILVQETIKDIQAGTLMYVPVYKAGMPTGTVEQRRAAIKGWVYSPYRMDDLMNQILGHWDVKKDNPIYLQIYDGKIISKKSLLYDSRQYKTDKILDTINIHLHLPVSFNHTSWTLDFSQYIDELTLLNSKVILVFSSGFIISILLFSISLSLLKTQSKAKQILVLNEQLHQLNAHKDMFISVLAHDLKTPFSALLGFSDLLKNNLRKYEIDKSERYAVSINNAARQTYNLLSDLLNWAREEQGKLPFEPKNWKLSKLVEDVFKQTEVLAEAKKINLAYYPASDFMVYADENMLKTILRNLVSNAIKFTDDSGKVEIYSELEDKNILIRVIDTGYGIRPEVLKTLFEFGTPKASSDIVDEKSSGWGLKLCKEFIEKHGGKIWVESEPDKGSTFYFTLPYKE